MKKTIQIQCTSETQRRIVFDLFNEGRHVDGGYKKKKEEYIPQYLKEFQNDFPNILIDKTTIGLNKTFKNEVSARKYFDFNELDKAAEYMAAPQTTTVKLNNDYSAEVNKDGKIKVGCQEFTIVQIRKVVAAYEELNKP